MEVGIEDCLHIEFEYNKSKYVHCKYFKRNYEQLHVESLKVESDGNWILFCLVQL